MNSVVENLRAVRDVSQSRWEQAVPSRHFRTILDFCLFEVAFYFAYLYGMSFSHVCASPFWFPDSVLLCALLLNPPRRWWLFVLAPLPIRLLVAVPPGTQLWFLLATFAIDSAKGLLVAAALRRFIRNPLHLDTVREVSVYCLFAVLLVPTAAAFAGAGARHLLGFDYWLAWEQWFLGNALASLIVTPAILYWVVGLSQRFPLPGIKRCIEAGLLAFGIIVTSYLAFNTESRQIALHEARFYAPVPFLFWAAIRFGMFGASGAISIVAFFAIGAAIKGRGMFAGQTPGDTALALQHFLLLRAAPLYLVAILIEQMNRAEAEVHEQRAELAHAARVSTMGQLASALAHELSQPLGAILRNAEAGELILKQNPPDNEELRAILADIRQDDQRAGAVIDRMRSLLKRRNLEFEPLLLKPLVDQVVVMARTEMQERRITLRVDVPNGLPQVRGDRVHLQQVLLNLLVNGADALNGSPVEQRRLEVQVRRADHTTLEVAVRDFGHGVPKAQLARIFDPFFTTKTTGMGLGLAISKTIVETHGGRIWAENNADNGATFRFTLKTVGQGGRA